jgi:L-cysteine:1D-myo-inositol 2-amino-2-deoxy-alpha-D-glucopyranoside ligase
MRETALFREDMEALRVLPPRDFVGAVESIPEIVEAITGLVKQGAAYQVDDPDYPDIYFDHLFTGKFGYESQYDQPTMSRLFAERGGDPDRLGKRDPLDALLWRMTRPGEPSWPSELGEGRPGWHIECSAIAVNRLGLGFDVQGGGSDLVFPHHEYSAAHAEALLGEHPFAKHYVHAGMIGLDGEKMSKSRGNLVFVSKLRAEGIDSAAVRLALLSGHYRDDRAWSQDLLSQAQSRLHRWRQAVQLPTAPPADEVVVRIRESLADDLDTPRALAVVDSWVEDALSGNGSDAQASSLLSTAVDGLLGIGL